MTSFPRTFSIHIHRAQFIHISFSCVLCNVTSQRYIIVHRSIYDNQSTIGNEYIQGIRSGICPIIVQIKQVSSNFTEFPFRILNDKMTTIELLHVCLILPTAVGCGSVRQNPKRRHEFDKSLGKQICNRHLNILVLSSSCISNASCHYTIPMINILSAFV